MNERRLRTIFLIFYYTLGIVVCLQSVQTAWFAGGIGTAYPPNVPLICLAGAEAIAAILFLIPATMKIGAWILLVIFVIAIIIHGHKGELQSTLFVYAAGVLLVMFDRSAFLNKKDNQ